MRRRLLRWFRAVARLSAVAWVAVTAAATFGLRPRHRRDAAARAHWLQRTCHRALAALGIRYTARGRLRPGAWVVSNHLGYVDILVFSALTPVTFVAKREVRDWPFFGWFARQAGTRFIDREHRGDVARVGAGLPAPRAPEPGVVLFLEGTSTAGDAVRPFKSSLLEPAAKHRWPVTPAAISYTVPAGHVAAGEVCWWGKMTLLPHLFNLASLPWIEARVAWGEPIVATDDRKRLAGDLHAQVVALHAALARTPDPDKVRSPVPSLATATA